MLKMPYTGDVEFVFKNGVGNTEDGTSLKLYGFRNILEGVDKEESPTLDFSCSSPLVFLLFCFFCGGVFLGGEGFVGEIVDG